MHFILIQLSVSDESDGLVSADMNWSEYWQLHGEIITSSLIMQSA